MTVYSLGAVYTSLIDLTLYLLYEVRGGGFVLPDPLAKIQLKNKYRLTFFFPPFFIANIVCLFCRKGSVVTFFSAFLG
jgi:hypothetical protein